MKLSFTRSFRCPPAKLFAALTDPAVLQKCIAGCETMILKDDTFEAMMKIGIAGIKGTYRGKVRIKDPKPPASFTMEMEGKGAPGFVKGTGSIRLEPDGDGTKLFAEGDAQVGGPIVAVGSRLIEAASRKLTEDFFERLRAQVETA
jgi:carbon monoxide dehydrogenase subunit G